MSTSQLRMKQRLLIAYNTNFSNSSTGFQPRDYNRKCSPSKSSLYRTISSLYLLIVTLIYTSVYPNQNKLVQDNFTPEINKETYSYLTNL